MLNLLKIIFGSLVGFFGGSIIYLILAVINTNIFCPKRLYNFQTFEEVYLSINSFKYGVPLSICFKKIVMPYLKLYTMFSDYYWYQNFLFIILYFILFDLLNYFIHRILHFSFLYRYIHSYHHQFKDPSPFGSIAIHPLEFFVNSVVPSTIISIFIPTHLYIWMFSYIIHIIWTVLIHDGIKYNKNNKNNILMDSEKHGMHHKYPLKNFAFIIYYWDIVFNTNH